jgi:alcohol-forming fatty acyl-CoA reductase
MKALCKKMNEADRKKFYFNVKEVDLHSFIENYILGTRQYVLKEKPETLPKARKLLKK